MNQLAEELKSVVNNYTDEFKVEVENDYVDLYLDEMTHPLAYDIIVLSKSLDYGFIIYPTPIGIKIEFYKTI